MGIAWDNWEFRSRFVDTSWIFHSYFLSFKKNQEKSLRGRLLEFYFLRSPMLCGDGKLYCECFTVIAQDNYELSESTETLHSPRALSLTFHELFIHTFRSLRKKVSIGRSIPLSRSVMLSQCNYFTLISRGDWDPSESRRARRKIINAMQSTTVHLHRQRRRNFQRWL